MRKEWVEKLCIQFKEEKDVKNNKEQICGSDFCSENEEEGKWSIPYKIGGLEF